MCVHVRCMLSQLLHARWAMLAAIGALIPEALAMSGVELGEPVWWKVGYAKLSGDLTLNYAGIEGFRIAGKQVSKWSCCLAAAGGSPRVGQPGWAWGHARQPCTSPEGSWACASRVCG